MPSNKVFTFLRLRGTSDFGAYPAFVASRSSRQSSLASRPYGLQSGLGRMASRPVHAWPRMMRRPTAAAYCDLSEAGLEREVAAGRLPLPVKLDGKDHWSRVTLDEYLARLAGESSGDWRKGQPLYAA
jgi:hypothetical protein